ncbi:MAG: YaiO family outer rane beta-barrel protein, partial [Pseudomonadota bacterium]
MRHSLPAGLLMLSLLAAAPARAAEPPAALASPAGFDERFLAARALAHSGRHEAALSAYSTLLADFPDNGDVLVGRGRVHAWMKHWSEAEADLLAAVKRVPQDTDAWSALGDLYLWSDRPMQATDAYSKWATLAPDAPEPRAALDRVRRARADAENALASAATAGTEANLAGSRSAEAFIPGNFRWTAGLAVDHNAFSGAGSTWTDSVLSLRHRWDRASLGFEALESRRFGINDHAFAADAYVRVLPRTTLNLRLQLSDAARLYPGNRWRAEVFQGVGQGWELSAGYDRLGFSESVDLLSLGIGRYTGPWYYRLRYQHVPSTTGGGNSDSLRGVGRWYFKGDGEHYIEL